MHSERFLNATILPAIQEVGVSLHENPDICFLRVRADKSVLPDDCKLNARVKGGLTGETRGWDKVDVKSLVESIVGTSCSQKQKFLACNFGADDETLTRGNATIGI